MPFFSSEFDARVVSARSETTLLDYLTERFTYRSMEWWKKAITGQLVKLDGVWVTPDTSIKNGQKILFKVVNHWEPEPLGQMQILKRKNDVTLVHKPPDSPVHKTGQIFFSTLVNQLREKSNNKSLSPLNRLDRESSGIVAFSDNPWTLRNASQTHPNSIWHKMYIAIVHGNKRYINRIVDCPLSERKNSAIRCQMFPCRSGKRAISIFHTIRHWADTQLVVAAPITGRKHQIRAHLALLGSPIVGDKIYSLGGEFFLKRLSQELDDADYSELGASHQLLHCFFLEIKHSTQTLIKAYDLQLEGQWRSYSIWEIVTQWIESSAGISFLESVKNISRNTHLSDR